MHIYKYSSLFIFFLILTLSSCVSAPSHSPTPVSAGYSYEGSYINIQAPNSDGWYLLQSSTEGMEFSRQGAEQAESFAAQVLIFPLPKINNDEEFLALIKESFETDKSSVRYTEVSSSIQYSNEREYLCVRTTSVHKDHQAQTSENTFEELLLQVSSLYCQHPIRKNTGFASIYSHRGNTIYDKLSSEAQGFINGVQVPAH